MKSWRYVTSDLLRVLPLWVAAVWAVGMTCMGFVVVPMLFAYLPSAAIAGTMAARLFSLQSWISTGCCLLLLLALRSKRQEQLHAIAPAMSLLALAGLMLAMLLEFAVTPHILERENLALWHRVGTGMYFVEWLCALWAFGKISLLRPRFS